MNVDTSSVSFYTEFKEKEKIQNSSSNIFNQNGSDGNQSYLELLNMTKTEFEQAKASNTNANTIYDNELPLFNNQVSETATTFEELSQTQNQKSNLEKNLDNLYEAMQSGELQLATLSDNAVTNKSQVDQNKQLSNYLGSEIASLNGSKDQRASVESSISGINGSITSLKQQIKELKKNPDANPNSQELITQYEAQITQQEVQKATLEEQLSTMQTNSEIDAQIASLEAQKDMLNNQNTELEGDLAKINEEMEQTRSQINEHQVSIKALELSYLQAEQKEEKIQTQYDAQSEALSEEEMKVNKYDADVTLTEEALNLSREKYESIFSASENNDNKEEKAEK